MFRHNSFPIFPFKLIIINHSHDTWSYLSKTLPNMTIRTIDLWKSVLIALVMQQRYRLDLFLVSSLFNYKISISQLKLFVWPLLYEVRFSANRFDIKFYAEFFKGSPKKFLADLFLSKHFYADTSPDFWIVKDFSPL